MRTYTRSNKRTQKNNRRRIKWKTNGYGGAEQYGNGWFVRNKDKPTDENWHFGMSSDTEQLCDILNDYYFLIKKLKNLLIGIKRWRI